MAMSNDEITNIAIMRDTPGWILVVTECKRRMGVIKENLTNSKIDIEHVRELQGEYKGLREFLNKFDIK